MEHPRRGWRDANHDPGDRARMSPQPRENASVPDWLLGTWKLVSVVSRDIASGATVDFFGPDPLGYITYSADHRMMVVIVRSGRQKPAGASATPAEAEALLKSLASYSGTLSISGNHIT